MQRDLAAQLDGQLECAAGPGGGERHLLRPVGPSPQAGSPLFDARGQRGRADDAERLGAEHLRDGLAQSDVRRQQPDSRQRLSRLGE